MNNWKDDFPADFPIERIVRRAIEDGGARARRRQARERSIVGVSLVVVLVAVGLAARSRFDERGRQLSAGQGGPAGEGQRLLAPVPILATNGRIAFVRSTGALDSAERVYVMNPDGSDQALLRQLSSPVNGLRWSPDGTTLAFSDNHDIFVMNADGSGLRQLTTGGTGNAWPTWSPDGTRIAYRRGGLDSSIWTMDTLGGDQKPLVAGPAAWPAWSPDGTRIAYSSINELSIISIEGKQNRVVVPLDLPADAPTWSPDGTRIAFRQGNGISVAYADGTVVKPVAAPPPTALNRAPGSGTPTAPDWSPDGSKIAYSLLESGDHCSVWTINPDGTGQTQLTDSGFCDRDVAWQPVPKR